MCWTFRLLRDGDNLPFDRFVAQVRRWWLIDLILACLYFYNSTLLHGALVAVGRTLCFLYLIDSAVLFLLTDPKRVREFPMWTFHANTLINCCTLAVNVFYV